MILKNWRTQASRALYGVVLAGASLMATSAQALLVSLDTSNFAGTNARLEINLLDGDLEFGNNSVTAFGNTVFDPDQILFDFVAGSTLDFDLSFTRNFAGGDSDLIVINLLDAGTNFSLTDTDLDALEAPVPYQDALVVCRLDAPSCALPTTSDPQLSVRIAEPATLGLVALIPGFLGLTRARRKQSLPA